uniref:BPI1 domain-containing protein n=1 Tax=Haemonchus contortus TaxID=6289 RepID=A0A7I4YTL5_HAECO
MNTLAILLVLVAGVCGQENATLNIREPLTLTISPKVWNLLETKANLITDAVKSIQFPEKEEKVKKLLKYKVWNGHFEQFSVPKTGVTFEDMNNGVHLRVKGIQFSGSVQARLYIGGKLGRVRVSGDIKIKSSDAELDVILTWNDFSFTPTISMNSNLRLDFTHHLKDFNAIRGHVQKLATHAVNKKVPERLAEVINQEVNPKLQKLKQKLIARGLGDYDVEWTVQNQILRVAVKPKSSTGAVPPIKPINEMLCIEVNVAQLTQRAKRSVSSSDLDVTCVNPVAKCEGLACSYCTDVDVNPLPPGAIKDEFHNCIPGF